MQNEPKTPSLNNQEVNTIINGLTLLHKFQYDQSEYAAALIINVLREQKQQLEEDVKHWETEATIVKEQYTIIKQQLTHKKKKYTKRHPKFFKNKK